EAAGEERQDPHPRPPSAVGSRLVPEQALPVRGVPFLRFGQPEQDLALLPGTLGGQFPVDPRFLPLVREPAPPLAHCSSRPALRLLTAVAHSPKLSSRSDRVPVAARRPAPAPSRDREAQQSSHTVGELGAA